MARTWEETIKFDSGLSIGVHCVLLQLKNKQRRALVEITNRGKVYLLCEPSEADMYSSWSKVSGDSLEDAGKGRNGVIVWGARDPEIKKQFENPVATIFKAA